MFMEKGAVAVPHGNSSFYAVLPIHEYRNSGAVFAVVDNSGTHLLTAADIRGSWDAWVSDLVPDDRIFTNHTLASAHPGIGIH